MSRQYNEYMESKFELFGEQYEIVEPNDLESLMKAIEVKEAIESYLSNLAHDYEIGGINSLLQEQEDYINRYLEELGDFDNRLLSSNISYLAKKNNLRIGDVEKMLGISAGYISRTTKEGSGKKLSIDVVWKIARLFETSINALINTDLRVPSTNTDLLVMFLSKLLKDTHEGIINWIFEGGYEYEVSYRFIEMKLVSEISDEENDQYFYRYFPNDHLNPDMNWYIGGSIICCEKFNGDKDLVMIPLAHERHDGLYGVDCYLVWKEKEQWKWQKVYYSNETPTSKLDDYAKAFYEEIMQTEFDAMVLPDVKSIISNYLRIDD